MWSVQLLEQRRQGLICDLQACSSSRIEPLNKSMEKSYKKLSHEIFTVLNFSQQYFAQIPYGSVSPSLSSSAKAIMAVAQRLSQYRLLRYHQNFLSFFSTFKSSCKAVVFLRQRKTLCPRSWLDSDISIWDLKSQNIPRYSKVPCWLLLLDLLRYSPRQASVPRKDILNRNEVEVNQLYWPCWCKIKACGIR